MSEHAPSPTAISPPQQAVQALAEFLRVLRRRSRYPIATTVLAIALGAVYYFAAERQYEATALLQVIQSRADLLSQQQAEGSAVQNLIPTNEKLLTSPIVIETALEQIRTFEPALRIDFEGVPPEKEAKVLASAISASGLRLTDIIQVRCRSKSPAAAQALLGAVVESYLAYIRENHKDVSARSVDMLKRERIAYETQLRTKEAKLLEFKRAFGDLGLRAGGTNAHPAVQRVLRLNETYLAAQGERMRLEALSTAVDQAVARRGDLGPYLLEIDPTLGREMLQRGLGVSQLDMQTLAQLEQELLKDRARLEGLKPYLGDKNPEVRELESSIAARSEYLATYHARTDEQSTGARERLTRIVVSTLADQLAKARAYEVQLQREYAASERSAVELVGKLAQLEILEHEAANLRQLNDVMLDRIAALDISQDKAGIRVEVVGRPHADSAPVWPKLYLVAFACVALGFGAGAVLAYVHDLLDDRFRSPDEFQEQIGAPALAVIRKLPPSEEFGAEGLFVHVRPNAVECEAFRTLRTTLAFSKEDRDLLAITSSEPGDGKTTVISNLGVAFAQAGKRTLLIDADLRKPGLSRFFEMRGQPGLSEILRADEPVGDLASEFVLGSGIDDMDVIPCGSKPGNPSELLSAGRLAELMNWALASYDQVLVDCPPALAGPDAAIVASHADGLLMVVTPHKNQRRVVLRAVAELRAMKAPLIGIVANQIDARSGYGYQAYGYGYGYGYSEAYGVDDEQDDDFFEASPVAARRSESQPARATPASRSSARETPFAGEERPAMRRRAA